MEARKIKLLEFIGNGKKTFNIPVYQRNYDWKEEQCRKLFEDIQNIVKSDYEIEHFLGTVVFVSSKSEMNFNEYVLIDGQQRITSIMLLLKVLHEKVTDENDTYYYYFYNFMGNHKGIIRLKEMCSKAKNIGAMLSEIRFFEN